MAGQNVMRRGITWDQVPDDAVGMVHDFPDVNWDDSTGVKTKNTNSTVRCRLVRNVSGGTLAPALLVDYKTGSFLTEVDSLSGTTSYPAGMVDEFVPSAGVPDDDYFWIVVDGPTKGTDSGSGCTARTPVAAAASGEIADASSPPTDNDVGLADAAIAADATGRIYLRLPYTG